MWIFLLKWKPNTSTKCDVGSKQNKAEQRVIHSDGMETFLCDPNKYFSIFSVAAKQYLFILNLLSTTAKKGLMQKSPPKISGCCFNNDFKCFKWFKMLIYFCQVDIIW